MADTEETVPAGEQQPAEGADNTQQEAATEGQGEATQEAGGQEAQEANADTQEPQNAEEGGAGADGDAAAAGGGGGDGDGVGEEQAPGEDQATTDPVPESQAEPDAQQQEQEEAPQQDAEPEQEPALQHEAEPAEPEPEAEPEPTQEEQSPAVELSEEEKAKYRRIFDRKAVDGRLDLKGFKVLFRLMGQVLSAQDAETMFDEGDRDDNGTIEFDEFCRLYAKFSEEEQTRREGLMGSINKLFPCSDGEPVELRKVESLLLKLQQPNLDNMRLVREKSDLNANDVRSMVRSMDRNGDGLISKQEFVETLTKHLDMA